MIPKNAPQPNEKLERAWSNGPLRIICNSLDSTLRTALASFYRIGHRGYSIGGILSVIGMLVRRDKPV
jgi:hypothetical protein